MSYVTIDVDLDEFETYELINELVKRFKSFRNKQRPTDSDKNTLREELEPLLKKLAISPLPELEIKTLDDKIKFEYLTTVWHKYTSSKLEQLLP